MNWPLWEQSQGAPGPHQPVVGVRASSSAAGARSGPPQGHQLRASANVIERNSMPAWNFESLSDSAVFRELIPLVPSTYHFIDSAQSPPSNGVSHVEMRSKHWKPWNRVFPSLHGIGRWNRVFPSLHGIGRGI